MKRQIDKGGEQERELEKDILFSFYISRQSYNSTSLAFNSSCDLYLSIKASISWLTCCKRSSQNAYFSSWNQMQNCNLRLIYDISSPDNRVCQIKKRPWFALQPVLSLSCRRSGLAVFACYKESKHSNNNRKSNKKHSSWRLGECGNSFRGPAKRNIINIWHCFMEKLLDFIPRRPKWPRMINYHGWHLCAFLYTAY